MKGGTAVYGLQLVLVLVVLGGLIAYLGDIVGMRVGRGRLSLFGLRPKHSSIIITVATGALIAAVSLTVIALASKPVQTALFRLEEIQAELAQTSEALRASEEELEELKAALDAAAAELDAVRREKERLAHEVKAAKAALEEVRTSLKAPRRVDRSAGPVA